MGFVEGRSEHESVEDEEGERSEACIQEVLEGCYSLVYCEGVRDGRVGEREESMKGCEEELALLFKFSG